MTALFAQGQSKGPDPLQGDDSELPARLFGQEITDEERRNLITKAYEQLKTSYKKFLRPEGTKTSPAKTCRDLSYTHPDLPSGEYWVDPNEGDIKDAIVVHCDMEHKATCVLPQPSMTQEFNWVGRGSGITWLGEDIKPGFEFTYKADTNQLRFLQLLSSEAWQQLTYHCKKSVAVFDATRRNLRSAMQIMTAADTELKARGNRKFRYRVLEDGCKTKTATWSSTKIEYKTNKPQRLPFIDVGLRDVGESDQAFKIELSHVCFS